MSNTAINCPDLYTNPPKTGIPGLRCDVRSMAVTAAQLVTTNIFVLGILPAGHKLVDWFLETTDLDTGASAVIDVGVCNWYYRHNVSTATALSTDNYGNATNNPNVSISGTTTTTVADTTQTPVLVSGSNLITGATTGQAGGRAAKTASLNVTQVVGIDYKNDRLIGINFTTAPQTAAAGTLTLGLFIDEP